ncbi:MAG: cell division protein ZapA [Treponema sp.]|jgi:cell division protein ZapA (FtsZ GTPase activity inhibitor)|nr:cell division protein ZapA [Treponema sp.]
MGKGDLRIDILGTSIVISADEDARYLEDLLGRYRAAIESTQNMTGLKDPLKIAILTGYLLCDELQKSHTVSAKLAAGKHEEQEAEQLTLELITRIDNVLLEHKV